MRLTSIIKDAFVTSVLDDVPEIDYRNMVSKLLLEDSIQQLPTKLQLFARDKSTEHFMRDSIYTVTGMGSYFVFVPRGSSYKPSPECLKVVDARKEAYKAQEEERKELRKKLWAIVNSVNTSKALVELLPQFEKYLPKEEDKTINLPAVTGVMAEFVKAGWPKYNTKEASA